MLADAVAPHGGNVIWRAFIYDEDVDPDRAKRAYIEFTKLDGQFRPNVLVQVKNGAIDFMPREPFHPLFGALKQTPVLAEIQATQEYLGQAKHLVYLGTMWEEFLEADTHAKGTGLDGRKGHRRRNHPAAGDGHGVGGESGPRSQLVRPPLLAVELVRVRPARVESRALGAAIADEWTRMTFGNDPKAVATIRDMMMRSREAFVNYTMPLGLHHLIGGDHYAPMPENAKAPRADWTATYYHQASADGVGFDRTMKGNGAVGQYFPPVRDMFDNAATCPEEFLLWFHRLPWNHRTKSGKTLWAALCEKYHDGAARQRRCRPRGSRWPTRSIRSATKRSPTVSQSRSPTPRNGGTTSSRYFQEFSGLPIVTGSSRSR